jgi:hypothetical protein
MVCYYRREKGETLIIASLHKKKRYFVNRVLQDINKMDRIRWSEKAIPFRNLVDDPAIQKPALGK